MNSSGKHCHAYYPQDLRTMGWAFDRAFDALPADNKKSARRTSGIGAFDHSVFRRGSDRSRKLVTFIRPFQLTGMDQIEPPGTLEVTTEEEEIGDLVFEAYRRIATTIYLPPRAGDYGAGGVRLR